MREYSELLLKLNKKTNQEKIIDIFSGKVGDIRKKLNSGQNMIQKFKRRFHKNERFKKGLQNPIKIFNYLRKTFYLKRCMKSILLGQFNGDSSGA